MKLAEAIGIRADLQKRLELFRTRLVESAKVQEGETQRKILRFCFESLINLSPN